MLIVCWLNFALYKARAMQNVRDCLRFKKFFHHRVQRVVQLRETSFFVDRKKTFFAIRDFPVFGVFPEKDGFLDFFRARNVLKLSRAHILNQCNELYRLIYKLYFRKKILKIWLFGLGPNFFFENIIYISIRENPKNRTIPDSEKNFCFGQQKNLFL